MFKKLAFGLAAAAMSISLGGCAMLNAFFGYEEEEEPPPRRVYYPAGTMPRWPTDPWPGGYVFIPVGGGTGRSNQTDKGVLVPGPGGEEGIGDGSFNMSGGLIGGGGGYNLQFYHWVFGLETDYSWADISGSSNGCGAFVAHTCSTELDSFGSSRGRIGYALGTDGTWLLYGTGGLAYGELKGSDSLFNTSGSKFRTGWTVGAGIEKALAQNWTVKGEWLYVDLGHAVLFNAAPGIPETASFTANVFRGGVTYKFY